jgi:hypothetical membrane protein
VHAFTVRYPGLGPLVWVSSAIYFAVQVFVAWIWKNPRYSVVSNTISDLGNTRCGLYAGAQVCSPRHVAMNLSFIFLGVVMAAGSLLIHQEFVERDNRAERLAAAIGFTLMSIAGLGTAVVGLCPENTFSGAHRAGAVVAIVGGNVAIFVLGLVLPLKEGMRMNMLLWSVTSLVAALLFAGDRYLGIGRGTMERLAAYPETVWLIRFGIYISRNPYSRGHARGQPVVT